MHPESWAPSQLLAFVLRELCLCSHIGWLRIQLSWRCCYVANSPTGCQYTPYLQVDYNPLTDHLLTSWDIPRFTYCNRFLVRNPKLNTVTFHEGITYRNAHKYWPQFSHRSGFWMRFFSPTSTVRSNKNPSTFRGTKPNDTQSTNIWPPMFFAEFGASCFFLEKIVTWKEETKPAKFHQRCADRNLGR